MGTPGHAAPGPTSPDRPTGESATAAVPHTAHRTRHAHKKPGYLSEHCHNARKTSQWHKHHACPRIEAAHAARVAHCTARLRRHCPPTTGESQSRICWRSGKAQPRGSTNSGGDRRDRVTSTPAKITADEVQCIECACAKRGRRPSERARATPQRSAGRVPLCQHCPACHAATAPPSPRDPGADLHLPILFFLWTSPATAACTARSSRQTVSA